jgi:carbon monoxide dehydrogenase subunit G
MWKKLSLGVLALLVTLAATVATGPAIYRVERSATVEAPAEMIRSELINPQSWIAWSPREGRDPQIVRRYGGPPSGLGASYYWSGDAAVGRGRMTVVGVGPDHVEIELETEEPRQASVDFEFRLVPEGTGTRLTWTVVGENSLVDRAFRFIRNRRTETGSEVDVRLGQLKGVLEALAKVPVHRVERSTFVAAPPDDVRVRIANLHGWSGWSPWKGIGSGTATYGGEASASGVGSSLYWSGDGAAGQGRVTVVAVTPERVEVEVEVKGAGGVAGSSSNDLEFRVSPEGMGTRVTWTMTGDGGLEAADLERGLARLKALSEERAR